MAFLRGRLHPVKEIDKTRLARLLADLDSESFETRQAASLELARFSEQVEMTLRQALIDRRSLEARRRIEDLLRKLEPSRPSPETLRKLRGIEVLEHMNTPTARRCLEALAKGAPDARQTREAKHALERLAKRLCPDRRGSGISR